MSTAPAASPPPTPLAVRTWRRDAQRAVRLAVTAIRSAHTQYEEVSEAGASHLAKLCNTLLTLAYLPAMPMGVLSAMSQDVRAAAKAKLQRQAAGLAGKVLGCAEQLGTIAKVRYQETIYMVSQQATIGWGMSPGGCLLVSHLVSDNFVTKTPHCMLRFCRRLSGLPQLNVQPLDSADALYVSGALLSPLV
jgi:hypothetical protein